MPEIVSRSPIYDSENNITGYKNNYADTSVADAEGAAMVNKNQADAARLGITIPGSTYNPVSSSSGTSRADETSTTTAINGASAPNYASPASNMAYLTGLDNEIASLGASQEAMINQKYDVLNEGFKTKQAGETGQTSSTLARLGGYLGESGSGTGVMLSLAKSHRAELADLESKRQQALFEARKYTTEKKFELAKAKMAEARTYEGEVYKRQQDYLQNKRNEASDARAAGVSTENQSKIYTAISNGSSTVDEIFNALGGKVSAEDIAGFVSKVKPKGFSNMFAFDDNDTVLLLGAGMGQDDIAEVQDYVNKNGYTDAFRATLTAKERNVLDTIYYPKVARVAGVGGSISIAEAKALGLPTSIIGRSQDQIIADLNNPAPPVWFAEYVESNFADPSASATPEGLQPLWQEYRNEVLGQNAISKRKGSGSSSGGGDISFDSTGG